MIQEKMTTELYFSYTNFRGTHIIQSTTSLSEIFSVNRSKAANLKIKKYNILYKMYKNHDLPKDFNLPIRPLRTFICLFNVEMTRHCAQTITKKGPGSWTMKVYNPTTAWTSGFGQPKNRHPTFSPSSYRNSINVLERVARIQQVVIMMILFLLVNTTLYLSG